MRYLLLLLLALPAYAEAPSFTLEELLGARDFDPPVCKAGKCTMSEADTHFLFERNKVLERAVMGLSMHLQNCRGERGV